LRKEWTLKRKLQKAIQRYHLEEIEWLKHRITEKKQIELFITEVLGYKVLPFHREMLEFQLRNKKTLILNFRGSGKTTICTISKALHSLVCNPNIRILLVSKTFTNAMAFLREIKSHIESNERFIEIFGNLVGDKKWDESEITIRTRKIPYKEATITTIGVEGTVESKHYDMIIIDDMVTEKNSFTAHNREKLATWYYKELLPCLLPDGELHIIGNRFHPEDLYGKFIENDFKDCHLIFQAEKDGKALWPEMYPISWLKKKKEEMGLANYLAQYQNDCSIIDGEVFTLRSCQRIFSVPKNLNYYMGIDLAISLKNYADYFAIVIIGKDEDKYYVVDHWKGKINFHVQTEKIIQYYKKWDCVRAAIEVNSYQKAQYQNLKKYHDIELLPVFQKYDKMSRMLRLSTKFEAGKVFFLPGNEDVIEEVTKFPKAKNDDLLDALELAIKASTKGKILSQRDEPGLI